MAVPGARKLYPSLTLARVRQSALRFLSGAVDCDKVCHLTQIRRDLCLPCRHCSDEPSGWRYRACPAVSCTVRESKLQVVHDQTLQNVCRHDVETAQTSCTATANHGRNGRPMSLQIEAFTDDDPCRLSSTLTNWTLTSRHASGALKK